MASRKEQQTLKANLRQWFNTLGYRVTDTELQIITKNSRNVEFWRMIQKLVLPGESVQLIRSKLATYNDIQQLKYIKSDIEKLELQKQELLKKITASKSKTKQIVTNTNAIKQRMCHDSLSKSKNLDDLQNSMMKEILQKSVVCHCNKVQKIFKEAGEVLAKNSTQFKDEDKIQNLSSSSVKGILESECVVKVNAILQEVNSYMGDYVLQKEPTPSRKESLINDIRQLCQEFTAQDILSAIATNTSTHGRTLSHAMESIDLKSELKNLEFDVVNGVLVNNESTVAPNEQVENHLRELQKTVNKEWIGTLKNKNKSHLLRKSIDSLNKQLETEVQQLPFSQEEKSVLQTVLKFTVRYDELLAKEETFLKELQKLEKMKEEATKSKIETFKIHAQIKDFKRLSEDKQTIIKSLVEQTGAVATALSAQTSNIHQYVQNKLLYSREELRIDFKPVRMYPDVLSQTACKVPLDRLLLSPDSIPVKDLSIYQFDSSRYLRVFADCNLPLNLSSESLLKLVSSILNDRYSNSSDTNFNNFISSVYDRNIPDSNIIFDALRQALQDFDVFTSENIINRVDRHMVKLSASNRKIPSIKRMIKVYSDQPAQHLVPWHRVSGVSLQDILDQWTVRSSVQNLASAASHPEVTDALSSLSNIHISDGQDNEISY